MPKALNLPSSSERIERPLPSHKDDDFSDRQILDAPPIWGGIADNADRKERTSMNRTSQMALASYFATLLFCISATPCPAQSEFAEGRAPENRGGGLVSRFRAAITKQPGENEESVQGRSGGLRVPVQGFSNPWKKRAEDELGSIQGPIELNRALKPTKEPFAPKQPATGKQSGGQRQSAQQPTPQSQGSPQAPLAQSTPAQSTSRSAIGMSDNNQPVSPSYSTDEIYESQETPATLTDRPGAKPSTLDQAAGSKRELKTYDVTPPEGSFDAANTSRRRVPVTPTSTASKPKITKGNTTKVDDADSQNAPKSDALVSGSNASAGQLSDDSQGMSERVPSMAVTRKSNANGLPKKSSEASVEKSVSIANERSLAGLDVRTPQLRLRVDGPTSIPVGQSATYTIHATNEGTNKIDGLLIRAAAPRGVRIDGVTTMVGAHEVEELETELAVLWEIESLAPNDSKSMELQVVVLDAESFALNLEWTVAPLPTTMTVEVQQPKLELTLNGPSETQLGVPQKYQIQVKNSGKAPMPELVLQLQTETTGQYESTVGTLEPGETKRIDVEMTFDHPGLFPIVATAKSSNGKFEKRERIDVQVQTLELTATWTGPSEFFQGLNAEYNLVIENTGNVLAKNVACVVALPTGFDPVELPTGIARNGNQLRWVIPSIGANQKLEVPLKVTVNQSGEQRIAFQARAEGGRDFGSAIATRVEAIADLELTVIEPAAPAPVGQPVVYEIQIINRGSKAAENVLAIAQFSDGIEPQRIEGHSGRIVPGQALFDAIPAIPPKKSITLKVTCVAAKGGNHRFRAAVQCQGSEEDLLEEGSTRYIAGAVSSKQP